MAALVLSLIFLGLNAFFVAAEFALVKAQQSHFERIEGKRARLAKELLGKLDRYLSITQLGITIASLGLGWIGEPALAELGDRAAHALTGQPLGSGGRIAIDVVALAGLTYVHLLLGELVPKFIAIQKSRQTLLVTALPLRAMDIVFRPVLWVLERSQNAVLRLIGMREGVGDQDAALTEEEILGMLAASARRSGSGDEREKLVERVMRFGRRPVRHAMVPRVDLVTIPVEATREQAADLFASTGFSRIPVTATDPRDAIVGYLYVKDVLLGPRERSRSTIQPLLRDTLFVPQSSSGLSVLRRMQREHTPIAVLTDEYGGTSGIVTLEDLVEEVFGDIRDELDVEPPMVVPSTGRVDAWDVDAKATSDVLRDAGGPSLEGLDAESGRPLANVVVQRLGRLPRLGDVVSLVPGVEAQVTSVHGRRVQRLQVRVV